MAEEPLHRPRVVVNFAISLDGKITTRQRIPSIFTSEEDKRRFLAIRAMGDAVMAARGTIEADRMRMVLPDESLQATRLERGQSAQPLRVVVSGSGKLSLDLPLFEVKGSPMIILLTTTDIERSQEDKLRPHLTICKISSAPLDLEKALERLRLTYNIRTLVCEGGPNLLKGLFARDLIDEIHLTVTPWLFGGTEALTLTGLAGEFLPRSQSFQLASFETVGEEIFTHYVRKKALVESC